MTASIPAHYRVGLFGVLAGAVGTIEGTATEAALSWRPLELVTRLQEQVASLQGFLTLR